MLKIIAITLLITNSWALYPKNSNVIELTPDNFDELVINSHEVWIVEFFAPWCGHCQQFVPEFEKAANALKGVVKVGAVNADGYKTLGHRFRVQGFPTIKLFGAKKNPPSTYSGQRTAQALIDAALVDIQTKIYANLGYVKTGKSKDVIELTDEDFDKTVLESDDIWLVEFYAPWCGHCKDLAPHWAEAATELRTKVKLGAIDVTAHKIKASKLGIKNYPTIKYFPNGKKNLNLAEDYDGGRTSEDIINWALRKYNENILPPPEVSQILDEDTFKKECEEKNLCVISILPHILDCQADCRLIYLETLQNLREKYKKYMWGWIWSEAEAQHELEFALDMGGFGYPTMAVLNVKKMKYSLLRGSFSKEGIDEFLRDLSYGRGDTAFVRGETLPNILTIDPWDGQDGELPLEDEFVVSDEDMDEKDEL